MVSNSANVSILMRLKDEASAGLRQAGNNMEKVQKQFRSASIFMAGASTVLGGALFGIIRAAKAQEDALTKLQATVERTGVSYESISDDVSETIDELVGRTDFSRADIITALEMLTTMTGNADDALKLLPLSLDVASQRSVSLETATRNVTRAVRDGAGELAENYIKELITATTEAERFALVEERYGGAAEANRDPIKAMGSALKNLAVQFKVHEIANRAADAIGGFAEAIGDLDPKLLEAVGLALVGLFAAFAVGAGVAGIIALVNPITLIIAGIAALAVGIFFLVRHWDVIWPRIQETALRVWSTLEGWIDSKWAWLVPGGALAKGLLFLARNWDTLWNGMLTVVQSISNGILIAVETMVNGILVGVRAAIKGLNYLNPFKDIPTIDDIALPRIDLSGLRVGGGDSLGGIGKFAHGGIVTRPTLGVIGEAGPEAVIPLNRAGNIGGAGGASIVINFSDIVLLDNEASMNRLATIIHRKLRNLNRAYPGLA